MSAILDLLKTLKEKNIRLDLDINENLVVKGDRNALNDTLVAAIKEMKPALIDVLKQNWPLTKQEIKPISRDKDYYPTSFSQQRLWFLDQMEDETKHFNMPQALKLSGDLNINALNSALTTIVERHESLRTYFKEDEEGQPVQCIRAPQDVAITHKDLSSLKEGQRQLEIAELVVMEAARPFRLDSDLMIRATLIKTAEKEHVLLVTLHHIASDGWSMAVLINEFSTLYTAYSQALPNPLPKLDVQYADYAVWQRDALQGEALEKQLSYWEDQLAGLPEVHSLPLDYSRPLEQTFEGEIIQRQLSKSLTDKLSQFCLNQGATLFMGLQAAFSVLLSRYSNENDIVIGTSIANREQAEIAGLIGFFVNNLVLRSDLSESPSFKKLLSQSKRSLLQAYAHQQVPFEQIVERLQPQRNLSHSPLFQVMLVLQNNEQGVLTLPGLTMSTVEQNNTVAKYDLTLNATENEQGLLLGWEFNTGLFARERIEKMAVHFENALENLLDNPEVSVGKVSVLSPQEEQRLIIERNNTTTPFPKEACAHELFEELVEKAPEAIAVKFENEAISYKALNERANRLAHYLLRQRQVKADSLVGICLDRSLEMVVSVLAVLKAGGAYVPLDPDYPKARLDYLLEDANLTTVLTQMDVLQRTSLNVEQSLCLDDPAFKLVLEHQASRNIPAADLSLHSQNLAYAIYTSGSTGNPKASLLVHQGLTNLALGQIDGFSVKANSQVLQFASFAFDAATSEIFMALLKGATLIIPSREVVKSADALSALVEEQAITHVTLPPVMLPLLTKKQWQTVETLIVAGDACPLPLAQEWSQGRQFINAYGPSETTVCATLGEYKHAEAALHIGRPLQNVQVYVLNEERQLVPEGASGELYIGGMGLSRGYLNRETLTHEKFVPNPFYSDDIASSKRLYRTGDLVRWTEGNNLEFLGRIDQQVKIRGFRVELGEIENTLISQVGISDAIVTVWKMAEDDKRLVAYLVRETSEGDTLDQESLVEQLRQSLAAKLPDYMMPSAFVCIDKIPLTPNGKVNRKALPEPDISQVTVTYIPPTTPTEERLCELWQSILSVERIGIADNFFHRGGHSLLMLRLVKALEQDFNMNVSLKVMFQFPDLQSLAAYIDLASTNANIDEADEDVAEIETFAI